MFRGKGGDDSFGEFGECFKGTRDAPEMLFILALKEGIFQ